MAVLASSSCGRSDIVSPISSQSPIHLEEHLASALIESAQPPTDVPDQLDWTFEDGNAKWKALSVLAARENGAGSERVPLRSCTLVNDNGALRVSLAEATRFGNVIIGGVYTELDDWSPHEWGAIVLRARRQHPIQGARVLFELNDDIIPDSAISSLMAASEIAPMFSDDTALTYAFPIQQPDGTDENERRARLALVFAMSKESSIDLVSATAVPAGEVLAWASTVAFQGSYGVTSESRVASARRSLYAHTPARITFRLRLPEAGRLDFGLGVARDDVPVTFTVTIRPDGGAVETLFDETHADRSIWAQRRLDVSRFEGQVVSLALEATADRHGAVALWSAPTLSGSRSSDKPNVILYVIDGAGADFMSVFGYERPTTPQLEKIALRGAVFERAHSNATWTQPSTASFVTSLHHSVLGGFRPESSPLPSGVTTLAQHLHTAGYQTASFTSNPNAARSMGPEHGTDVMQVDYQRAGSASSVRLHGDFWRFRKQYPAEPYWAHFQTTDVHPPYDSVNPYAGRYVSSEHRSELAAWENEIRAGAVGRKSLFAGYRDELARAGIDSRRFYETLRGLYDEAMTQQDDELGRLVARLESSGEWPRTLLIIASDHGHPAASFPRFGRGLLDPEPPDWEGALFGSLETRIPLIFVWPGHIEGGQRFRQPVSMIDILPTVLDLVGLPPPSMAQGQSLAPLLLGEEGFEPRPVILDEFRADSETGELVGNIELIDGRWGASLEIGPTTEGEDPRFGRHTAPAGGRTGSQYFPNVPRLLLYDLETDPYAVHHVNDRYPDRVERYGAFLRRQWMVHQALARQFPSEQAAPFSSDELRALRSLGYAR